MWKLGLWPRNSILANICFQFSVLVLCVEVIICAGFLQDPWPDMNGNGNGNQGGFQDQSGFNNQQAGFGNGVNNGAAKVNGNGGKKGNGYGRK
jgi:hypothetical protein